MGLQTMLRSSWQKYHLFNSVENDIKPLVAIAFIVAVGWGIITLSRADCSKSSLIRNNKSVTSCYKTKFLLRRWWNLESFCSFFWLIWVASGFFVSMELLSEFVADNFLSQFSAMTNKLFLEQHILWGKQSLSLSLSQSLKEDSRPFSFSPKHSLMRGLCLSSFSLFFTPTTPSSSFIFPFILPLSRSSLSILFFWFQRRPHFFTTFPSWGILWKWKKAL